MTRLTCLSSLTCVATLLGFVMPAEAGLILTQAGTNDGFILTTFVSGYDAQYGPLAQGIAPDGNVITGSQFNGQIYVFKDVNGQTLSQRIEFSPCSPLKPAIRTMQ